MSVFVFGSGLHVVAAPPVPPAVEAREPAQDADKVWVMEVEDAFVPYSAVHYASASREVLEGIARGFGTGPFIVRSGLTPSGPSAEASPGELTIDGSSPSTLIPLSRAGATSRGAV